MLRKRSRTNSAGSRPKTLSQLLAEQKRTNPRRKKRRATAKKRRRRNASSSILSTGRRNPNRTEMLTKARSAKTRYETARTKYEKSGRPIDKAQLARAEKYLEKTLEETRRASSRLSAALRELEPRSTRRKTRKKSKSRKSTSRRRNAVSALSNPRRKKRSASRAKVGSAQNTDYYKKLRSTGSKTRFTIAFNKAFKAAKRRGLTASDSHTRALASARAASKRRSRRNPKESTSVTTRPAALRALSNPRRKKRSASRAKVGSAQNTDYYKKLRSRSSKTRFTIAFNKAFKAAKRRGLTAADSHTRALASARAASKRRSRRNPLTSTTTKPIVRKALSNPRRKKRSASRAKVGSAQNTDYYKKLRSTGSKTRFTIAFNKAFKAAKRRGLTAADAHRRALASARAASKRRSRKNPISSRVTSVARTNARKRVRAKRLRRGMSRQAHKVLGKYGPYTVRYTRDGKVIELRAQKSSSDYKKAKRSGLTGIYRKLDGKKNTPTSLNLRSVYLVHRGDKPTRAQMQKAVNIWAGAIDGGKIKGVTKAQIRRSRANPVKKHTIGRMRANPSALMRTHFPARRNEEEAWKTGLIGAGSFGVSTYMSNFLSSSLAYLFDSNVKDRSDRTWKHWVSETAPLAATGFVGGLPLYQHFSKSKSLSDSNTALAAGIVLGGIYSFLARNFVPFLGKLPGMSMTAEAVGDTWTFTDTDTSAPQTGRYLMDNQLGRTRRRRRRNSGMGRYVSVPTTGRYVSTPVNTGRYVSTPVNTGRYVSTPVNTGRYVTSTPSAGMFVREPTKTGLYRRRNPCIGCNRGYIGAEVEYAPVHRPLEHGGSYQVGNSARSNADFSLHRSLQDDLELYEPLTPAELQAEGLHAVADNGRQLKVVRAVPDVARQIAEANFGSIIGPSEVIRGAILVLVSLWDEQQDPALQDRMRFDTAPDLPKGAAYPRPGGVFSRVMNTSVFPSIDNQAAYQEFGVIPDGVDPNIVS